MVRVLSSPSSAMVRVAAPAKVNLTLQVTGRREDGYHLISSLVVFAGVFDRLTLQPAERISLEISGLGASALAATFDGDTIIQRAARALAALTGSTQGARITLHKTLPVAAGLGGGSADAAAVLHGLMRLWGVSLPMDRLMALAGSLGADVPVCLRGRASEMSGIGDSLHDAPPLPAAWLLLVNPGIPLSTATVFKARRGPFSHPFPLDDAPCDAAALAVALAPRHNDLTAAAMALEAAVGRVVSAVSALPDCLLSRMSGSGATCWGLFTTEDTCKRAAHQLRTAHPGWWIKPAPMLTAVDPFSLVEQEPVIF